MNNKYQEALDKIRRKLTTSKITTAKLFGKEVEAYEVHIDCEEEIKTIQELVDKATPKKPINFKDKFYISPYKCPVCKIIPHTYAQRFCDECGQALDWSEE